MLYCKFCLLLLIVDSIAQKWMTFEANEYFYDSDPNGTVGYDQAVEICNDYNATLAIITSQEQNQFIVDDLTGKQHTSLIIGLKRLNSNEPFKWQDGSPLNYTNWNETQPDGDGDCVIMIGDKWHDFTCDSPKQCVCQRSLAVSTTRIPAVNNTMTTQTTTTSIAKSTTADISANLLDDTPVIIAIVVVVVALLLCVGIFLYWKKRKSPHSNNQKFQERGNITSETQLSNNRSKVEESGVSNTEMIPETKSLPLDTYKFIEETSKERSKNSETIEDLLRNNYEVVTFPDEDHDMSKPETTENRKTETFEEAKEKNKPFPKYAKVNKKFKKTETPLEMTHNADDEDNQTSTNEAEVEIDDDPYSKLHGLSSAETEDDVYNALSR